MKFTQFFCFFSLVLLFSCDRNEAVVKASDQHSSTEVYENRATTIFPHLGITELHWDYKDSLAVLRSKNALYDNSKIVDLHFDGNSVTELAIVLNSGKVLGLSVGKDDVFYINDAANLADYRNKIGSFHTDVYGDGFARKITDEVTPRHFVAILASGLRLLNFKDFYCPNPVEPLRVATCFGYGNIFDMRRCANAQAEMSCPDGYVKGEGYENETQGGCTEVTFHYKCRSEL